MPVHDAGVMRGAERFGNLDGVIQALGQAQSPFLYGPLQLLPGNIFHNDARSRVRPESDRQQQSQNGSQCDLPFRNRIYSGIVRRGQCGRIKILAGCFS